MATRLHGTSKYMAPGNAALIAEAEFEDFAPGLAHDPVCEFLLTYPLSAAAPCICCGCIVSPDQKARTYARVYENKLEVNYPLAPFCCLTSELCINDRIKVWYYDKTPSRVGLLWGEDNNADEHCSIIIPDSGALQDSFPSLAAVLL